MANKRIKKKMAKANTIQAIHNAQVKLQEIEAETGVKAQNIKAQSSQSGQLSQNRINRKQRTLESLRKQSRNIKKNIDEYKKKKKKK